MSSRSMLDTKMKTTSRLLFGSLAIVLGAASLAACGDSGRPRHLDEPNVLHGNGGSNSGGSAGQTSTGGSGGTDVGGAGGTGAEDPDAGYEIGTDWDGDTRPTAEHAQGIDAAAGEDERGNADPTDAGTDGG